VECTEDVWEGRDAHVGWWLVAGGFICERRWLGRGIVGRVG